MGGGQVTEKKKPWTTFGTELSVIFVDEHAKAARASQSP